MQRDTKRVLVTVVLIAIVAAIAIVVSGGDEKQEPKKTDRGAVKVIATPGPDFKQPVVADADNEMEADEQAEARKSAPDLTGNPDLHEDTRDETPPGVTQTQIRQGKKKTDAMAKKVLKQPVEPAGAQAYSCPNAIVRNQSSLNGQRVGSALHFTVSGPGSLFAIRGLFNTPSFGASSNKIIELRGQCRTLVSNSKKAWAQGAANSAYISIEIVTNDLSRSQWLAAPIIKNGVLAAIVRDQNRAIGAPLRHVDPVGCAWTPGIVDHDDLECGNTHWDVGQNFPWDVFIKQVRAGVAAGISVNFTKSERAAVKCIKRKGRQPKCEQRLRDRNALLHKLGLNTASRRSRHQEIHRVLRRYS